MKSLIVLLASACWLHAPTLAWDINPESDLAGYRLYYRLDAAAYGTNYVSIIGRTNISLAVVPSSIGVYSFVLTAVGSNGLESVFSNEITWTNKPSAPKNLKITLNLQQSISPAGPWFPQDQFIINVPASTQTEFFRAMLVSQVVQ